MRRRLVLLFALIVILAAFVLPTSTPASLGCSGDNCGCGYYAEQCRNECAETGGGSECLSACRRESIDCSIACCDPYRDTCPYWWCQ